MVTILTGSFIFFAKHTEPLRALEDVIPRSSGDVRKYKVLDFRYSGIRDGKTRFGRAELEKFVERVSLGLQL